MRQNLSEIIDQLSIGWVSCAFVMRSCRGKGVAVQPFPVAICFNQRKAHLMVTLIASPSKFK